MGCKPQTSPALSPVFNVSKKTAKKIIAARQKAIQKEKAEKYWEKVRIQEDGCVAARQMEIEAARIGKR